MGVERRTEGERDKKREAGRANVWSVSDRGSR